MDLGEVVGRVLRGHWKLIVALVLLGAIPGLAIYAVAGSRYTAEARVQMDVAPPTDPTGATAAADSARAIVTGYTHVQAAIATTHSGHSVSSLTRKIKVQPLGSSGVVQILVSDDDAQLAAALANSLAGDLVRTRGRTSKSSAVLADLDKQIAAKNTAIGDANKKIDQVNAQLAGLTSNPNINQAPVSAGIAEAQLTAAVQERTSLQQDLTTLQQQRSSLLSANTSQMATVIESAVPPRLPNLTDIAVDVVLGCLIGAVVGIGLATLLETLRPTLIGRRALARLLDVPALGHVDQSSPMLPEIPSMLVRKLQLAANAAEARVVELVGVPSADRVDALARELQHSINGGRGPSGRVAVSAFVTPRPADELQPPSEGAVAIVIVAPEALRLIDLQPALDIIRLSRWPVLGVITYGRSGLPLADGRSLDRIGGPVDATRSA